LGGTATSFHCGNKGPRADVDIRSIKYLVPIKDHEFKGFYKVESVVTHEIPEDKYPVRLEFKLSKYTKLQLPVLYGIDKRSARGVPFTKEEFYEYCKMHYIKEE
jgi:hypothetical protein